MIPVPANTRVWLALQLTTVAGKSPLAAAIRDALVDTAKLNAVGPHAWRADTLARIPDYKISRADDLWPWRWNG